MNGQMRIASVLFLTFSLTFAGPAQDAGQQPLPSAPSAGKYPATQPTSPSNPALPPAPTPMQSAPAAQTGNSPAPQQTPTAAAPAAQPQQTTPAQQQTAPPQQTPPAGAKPPSDQEEKLTTIVKQVDEVNVVFTVTDKRGKFVNDLTKSDFQVVDDNKPAQQIRSFRAETNLPLRVGLLIDASNSIRDRFRFEQQAAIEFLNQIIHPDRDQAFVLGFDTTPEITQDFTGNPEKLANGVRLLRPGGGTAMYDAVYGACRDKLAKTRSEQGGLRRAIILVSDGEDNQSRVTRDDAIEEAQRAEVIVYAISTNVTGTKTRGDKILEAIAESTG